MKIAIIGAHPQETKALYENMSQRFSIIELAACSDPDMKTARNMAEIYGIPALEIDEILRDPEIKIILNATFSKDTEEITEKCLRAKKMYLRRNKLQIHLRRERNCMILRWKMG